jgi:hypothetical protein
VQIAHDMAAEFAAGTRYRDGGHRTSCESIDDRLATTTRARKAVGYRR